MDFRSSKGETITAESYLMRDLWDTGNENSIPEPTPPNKDSIRMILDRAWKRQNVKAYTLDSNSRKKYEFKSTHSLRKYFETHALTGQMKLFNAKLLMDHDIGLDKSYFKPTEGEILDDYLKVVDLLTISNEHRLQTAVDVDLKEKEKEIEVLNQKITNIENSKEILESRVEKMNRLVDFFEHVKRFSVEKDEQGNIQSVSMYNNEFPDIENVSIRVNTKDSKESPRKLQK